MRARRYYPLVSKRNFVFSLMCAGLVVAGCGKGGGGSNIADCRQLQQEQFGQILAVRNKIAKDKKVEPYMVSAADVMKDPEVTKIVGTSDSATTFIKALLNFDPETDVPYPAIDGYSKVAEDSSDAVMTYTIQKSTSQGAPPEFVDLKSYMKTNKLAVFKVRATMTPPPPEAGKPAQKPTIQEAWVGPMSSSEYDELTKGNPATKFEKIGEVPASWYSNGKSLALVVEGKLDNYGAFQPASKTYYPYPADMVKKAMEARTKDPEGPAPAPRQTRVGAIR